MEIAVKDERGSDASVVALVGLVPVGIMAWM